MTSPDTPGVVFLGPSWDLAPEDVPQTITVLPPARRGDIAALLERSRLPIAIGIVDGAFNESLSVSPKEVVRAIDRGVTMFGSSSMGALRAVECAPYGMVGIGRIFTEYQSGRVDADDEVAIVYDPETQRGLTEPLINLRLNMAEAVQSGLVRPECAERFLATAAGLYFPHRTLPTILRLFEQEVGPQRARPVGDYLRERAVDHKRADAELLLRTMASYLDDALAGTTYDRAPDPTEAR
jgi:hypothetical protein